MWMLFRRSMIPRLRRRRGCVAMGFTAVTVLCVSASIKAMEARQSTPPPAPADASASHACAASTAAAGAQASFEVAAVRRVDPNRQGVSELGPADGGRFTAKAMTLRNLVAIAYKQDSTRIESRFKWLDTNMYDITARTESTETLTADTLRPLLQNLLRERFHLTLHCQTREVPGFVLVPAKGGPKLQPGSSGKPKAYVLHGGLQGSAVPMAALAGMLSRPAGRPVMDRTGLEGTFDFKLSYAPDDDADSPLPNFFTAVEEQLGLKLTSSKVPVEFLVIDSVDENPTEN